MALRTEGNSAEHSQPDSQVTVRERPILALQNVVYQRRTGADSAHGEFPSSVVLIKYAPGIRRTVHRKVDALPFNEREVFSKT